MPKNKANSIINPLSPQYGFSRFGKEICIILIIKVIALSILWKCCFSSKIKPTIDIGDQLLDPTTPTAISMEGQLPVDDKSVTNHG